MAKVKVRREGNLLWEDECQPLTTEQMADIKSQFHPSNTANVNIVPYHIYDADEHIVGEWRETIDGVKKKKPVYEKTIILSSAVTIGINSYTSVFTPPANIGKLISMQSNSSIYGVCYYNSASMSTIGQFASSISGLNVFASGTQFTLKYIKTTDSWEKV